MAVSAPSAMSTRILESMKDLWETRALSDITLKADDILFPTHKTILVLSSDYFMAMLTSNMLETTSGEVELKGVSAKGLEPILKYIYTGSLSVTKDNICDVIMAATHLQMDAVLELCTKVINKIINTDNCVDLKNIAKMCSLEDIEYLAEDYILDNFASVMREGSHCGLDLRALLLCYFHERSDQTDAILIGPERKVFSLMVDWIKHGEDERMKDIARVMEVVRFPLMTLDQLDQVVTEMPELETDSACQRYIQEARSYLMSPTHMQVGLQSRKARIRNNPSVLVLTKHPDTGQLLIYALCLQAAFNPETDRVKAKWLHLMDLEGYIPDIIINPESVSSIVINDFLLLIGVHDKGANADIPPKSCYLFNPRTSNWTKLADLRNGRHRPALAFHGDQLYAFGGALSLKSRENSNRIECYDFKENAWNDVGKMPAKLRNHAACPLGDKIFICGGRREGDTLSYAVYLFDPRTMDSEASTPMPTACENHHLYNINNKVHMVLPREGVLKTYQDDILMWSKFWVRLGGPKVPEQGKAARVGGNIVFINGILENDCSESDSEDDLGGWERYPETEHACVEVVVGDACQGAGRVFLHENYPAGLDHPVVLAGIRLPWNLTNEQL